MSPGSFGSVGGGSCSGRFGGLLLIQLFWLRFGGLCRRAMLVWFSGGYTTEAQLWAAILTSETDRNELRQST